MRFVSMRPAGLQATSVVLKRPGLSRLPSVLHKPSHVSSTRRKQPLRNDTKRHTSGLRLLRCAVHCYNPDSEMSEPVRHVLDPNDEEAMPRKKSWPELVGQPCEGAEEIIKRDAPDVTIVACIPEGSPVTKDWRINRVRCFHNEDKIIVVEPRRG